MLRLCEKATRNRKLEMMDHREGHDHGSTMDQYTEMMSNLMGGGMMGNSFPFLPILAAPFIVWSVGLAVLGSLGFFAVRKLRRTG